MLLPPSGFAGTRRRCTSGVSLSPRPSSRPPLSSLALQPGRRRGVFGAEMTCEPRFFSRPTTARRHPGRPADAPHARRIVNTCSSANKCPLSAGRSTYHITLGLLSPSSPSIAHPHIRRHTFSPPRFVPSLRPFRSDDGRGRKKKQEQQEKTEGTTCCFS